MTERKSADRIIAQLKAASKQLFDAADAIDDARAAMRGAEVLIDAMADEIDENGGES